MKIINLLNMIANGEKLPKKIKLNDEIEVIENKKIEKFKDYIPLGLTNMSADFRKQDVFDSLMKIGNKINEIIDVINRGGK